MILDVTLGTFGQIRQQLLDPTSAVRAFAPEMLLLTHGCREALAGIPVAADDSAIKASISGTIEDIRLLWQQARETMGVQVIQQTLLDVTEPLFGNYDSMVPRVAVPPRVWHQ